MRYSIQQLADGSWELRAADGLVVARYRDRPGNTGYAQACVRLGTIITDARRARLAAAAGDPVAEIDGLLPERWISDAGIAFSEDTPGGRDFSSVEWGWRDPTASLVPLMLDTTSQGAHLGAQLAGYIEEVHLDVTTPHASGRFYDQDYGRMFRDLLLDGRRFGVSVDPTENVVATLDPGACVELDDDGYCMDWDPDRWIFSVYEIGGLTGTPFPTFANASIVLDTVAAGAVPEPLPIAASAAQRTRPPVEWLTLPEPRPGEPFLDGVGDDVLVPQRDRAGTIVAYACPLTITDEGHVYGHLTWWGQCHTGDPWGRGVCASASPSATGYAEFHTGTVVCDDGTTALTGPLTVGCEHSSAFDAQGVRDHMAHAGMGWADVHVIDGELGAWFTGVLRPGVTDEQLRVLRSLSLSGEWVGELAAALSVNASGLPVQREQTDRLAASAFVDQVMRAPFTVPAAKLAASAQRGGLTKLVGANVVAACPECGRAPLETRAGLALNRELRLLDDAVAELRALRQQVSVLERRTRPLVGPAVEAARARLG